MKTKEELITDILQVCAANGVYGMDHIFMELIFLDVEQLRKIATELYIKT